MKFSTSIRVYTLVDGAVDGRRNSVTSGDRQHGLQSHKLMVDAVPPTISHIEATINYPGG